MRILYAAIIGFIATALAEGWWACSVYTLNPYVLSIRVGFAGLLGAVVSVTFVLVFNMRRDWWWRWLMLPVLATAIITGAALNELRKFKEYRFRVAPTHVISQPFHREGWMSGSATLRHAMARHLIVTGELVGQSEAALVRLLDSPAEKSLTPRPRPAETTGRVLEWHLGQRQDPTGWMWNYDEYLDVQLDDAGTCTEAYLYSPDD